jgi:hypothetical protein
MYLAEAYCTIASPSSRYTTGQLFSPTPTLFSRVESIRSRVYVATFSFPF